MAELGTGASERTAGVSKFSSKPKREGWDEDRRSNSVGESPDLLLMMESQT